ncbi:chaperonin 10-like protein [Bisporella sp. PMI_857]|nr:chaperonin 10-like protein [Bisporella sp. PMI_857]
MTPPRLPCATPKLGSKGEIIQSQTTRPALTGDHVLVAVTASRLCGRDLLFRDNDARHEGIGVVAATGPDIIAFKKGDRVGWGFLQDTGGHCPQCTGKTDNSCPEHKIYGRADLDQGSVAYGTINKEARLFTIPKELSNEEVAPLMCAGATVFNVLDTYGVKSIDRVGFASKLGCEVTAFSNTASKESDALAFGASAYHTMETAKDLKLAGSLDVLITAATVLPDWRVCLPPLAPRAKAFPLTIGPGAFPLPACRCCSMALRFRKCIGTKRMDREGVEKAFGVLKEGKMRYRGVLVLPNEKLE